MLKGASYVKKAFSCAYILTTPVNLCSASENVKVTDDPYIQYEKTYQNRVNEALYEVLYKDFSFVIDKKTKTAFVRKIYIGTGEKKHIIVPSEITYLNEKYKVTAVADYAVEEVVNKLNSIELPDTLEKNEMYEKVINLLKEKEITFKINFMSNDNLLTYTQGCYVL